MKAIADRVQIGGTYGKLLVIKQLDRDGNHHLYFYCLCSCGNTVRVRGSGILSGNTLSCGCLNRDSVFKHGMTHTKVYKVWTSMRNRCSNPRHKAYKSYGGRGITVCESWDSFEKFLEDMGTPNAGESLDRVNNELGYSKSNCRWATKVQQGNNRRSCRVITYQGRTATVTAWARHIGIKPSTLSERLRRGWDTHSALSTPTQKGNAGITPISITYWNYLTYFSIATEDGAQPDPIQILNALQSHIDEISQIQPDGTLPHIKLVKSDKPLDSSTILTL